MSLDRHAVVESHQRGEDEAVGQQIRATCATCGWTGTWRKATNGWGGARYQHTDWEAHKDAARKDAADTIIDGTPLLFPARR